MMTNLHRIKWDILAGIPYPPGWYHHALTMIGPKRIDTIERLAEQVLKDDVPGDFCETGVWRGGACIYMRAILKEHDITDRKVYVCDSFEGLPEPNPTVYPSDKGQTLASFPILRVSLETVKKNFNKFGFLDDQTVFVKGWFKDTLPSLPVKKIALLRLDGDLYESTYQSLEALYPKLSRGGAIIIDDYGDLECCRQAVDDYRKWNDITEPIQATDHSEAFWRKGIFEEEEPRSPAVVMVIPTWNNLEYLMRTVHSALNNTLDVALRLVVIDNGSTDDTPKYLKGLQQAGLPVTVITNEQNVGFVKATNQGLEKAQPGELICLANDDIQITDPFTFARMAQDLEDQHIGMVVPTSDYVMGLQQSAISYQIPKKKHVTNLVVYFCGLMRYDAFERIGFLDERFGMGGNDDMDMSIRFKELGYQLLIDRTVFVRHYGSRTLLRDNDTKKYDEINTTTRTLLIEKWGKHKVDELFRLPDFLLYGPEYYNAISEYERSPQWLREWKRIADKIVETLRPANVLDVGCAHGMLVEALWDSKTNDAFIVNGIDVSEYALSQARPDIQPFLALHSVVDIGSVLDSTGHITRYDLAVCIEVLEHLNEADGRKAVENVCQHANRVLFSSTPDDTTEPTHQNVRPKEYWIQLFADCGFEHVPDFEASWLTAWAMLFVRVKE